jgi:DNA-binding IclR family transcriptional regulator
MEAKGVQTLNRTLDIIELLAVCREGMGVSEVSQQIGLHKSTVHRLLNALVQRGYIEKLMPGGQYRIGLKFIEISALHLNHLELKTEAVPILRQLSDSLGQTVHLAIRDGQDVVYIEKIEPKSSLRMYSQIGRRIPLYCSALGKSLVSDLVPEVLQALARGLTYKAFSERTLTNHTGFIQAVNQSRARGWSVDDGEYEQGIRCFGAAIRDYTGHIIAAVSATGERPDFPPEQDERQISAVLLAAQSISQRMGYLPRT